MRTLNTPEVLDIWQTGYGRSVTENSLRLIGLSCDAENIEEMAHLSLGERDNRLMQLRRWFFGNTLNNIAVCPSCSQKVEWVSTVDEIGFHEAAHGDTYQSFEFRGEKLYVKFRLPTSKDIFQDNFFRNERSDVEKILLSCIVELRQDDQPLETAKLPKSVFQELAREIEKHDPLSDISIQLNCPQCRYSWEASFDISDYLWKEIDHWAKQLLEEVYILALHFGWSEYDILAMHPNRRQFYLNKLSA
jgi:T4 bacteriophage base plate protein